MAGEPPAGSRPRPLVVRRLSDAEEPELLVDLRHDPHVHAGGADRHRHHPGDALHPADALAFNSVENIRRDVNSGLLGTHAVGASMFFFAVYVHIFRGLYYGSYKAPREVLWMLGVIIYLLMMATAFMGYVLPWGQMRFWAATVITNLFSAIPVVGGAIVKWLRGGFAVDRPRSTASSRCITCCRSSSPAWCAAHLGAAHSRQRQPDRRRGQGRARHRAVHALSTIKDMFGLSVFLIPFAWLVFFIPNYLGHPDNYIMANTLVTPAHIVPEWYFLPFYAILRAITQQARGRHRAVRLDRRPVLPALARYARGCARRRSGRCSSCSSGSSW